ncbi:hypothetical protein QNI22_14970 [Cytophagaceae bacterium BD1B2-1]|uniref:Uncharacterized protein n=2 Tax=Xanthocytophaga agilis TaxID=3048010 RepID=A0AAE3R760_9BACT|nr:hypothetical protein [Xanthocytophaga agilis]
MKVTDYEITTSSNPYEEEEGTRFSNRPVYHSSKNGTIAIPVNVFFKRYLKNKNKVSSVYGIFRKDGYRETFFKLPIAEIDTIIFVEPLK